MTIFRGPGGTGSATSDSDTTEFQEFVVDAQAARDAALAAQTAAELAETNAETAETNAETAETNAETAATNAASSASSAASSASSASSSASSASTSASNASSSASSASTSASAASSSASAASTSASNAATSATNAASSATAAASSATSASSSASTATTQATNAAASASAASTSASSASAAQTAAEAARDAALSAYDNFDDRYLGPKSADPTLDNDGNALLTGALYFNTASNVMKVYTGSSWVAAYVSAAGVLLAANNLSDVASTATSRTNLGAAGTGVSNTFTANQIVSVTDNTNAALRITQLGTGNALLVEDSTNPDSTPFVIDSSGVVLRGLTSPVTTQTGQAGIQSSSIASYAAVVAGAIATNTGTLDLSRSRGTVPAPTIVSSGDSVGRVSYGGYDGASYIELAKIEGQVAGTPGTNDMPGRLVFSTTADGASSPTERMRIDSAGRVGMGTTSPAAPLHVRKDQAAATYVMSDNVGAVTASTSSGFACAENGTVVAFFRSLRDGSGQAQLYNVGAQPLLFGTNNTERARIDSSGAFMVGNTGNFFNFASVSEKGFGYNSAGVGAISNNAATALALKRYSSTGTVQEFWYNTSYVGRIDITGTTTSYVTSSDYRLKHDIQPMTGALAKVAALKPCTYKWNADNSDGEGFIAHELAEVVPECVTGEKDAVDAEGKPVYQGIDTSFLVATLTAAIQEQQAIILAQESALNALTARVAALESN